MVGAVGEGGKDKYFGEQEMSEAKRKKPWRRKEIDDGCFTNFERDEALNSSRVSKYVQFTVNSGCIDKSTNVAF